MEEINSENKFLQRNYANKERHLRYRQLLASWICLYFLLRDSPPAFWSAAQTNPERKQNWSTSLDSDFFHHFKFLCWRNKILVFELTKLSHKLHSVLCCATSIMISCCGMSWSSELRLLVKIEDSLELSARMSSSEICDSSSVTASSFKFFQFGKHLISRTTSVFFAGRVNEQQKTLARWQEWNNKILDKSTYQRQGHVSWIFQWAGSGSMMTMTTTSMTMTERTTATWPRKAALLSWSSAAQTLSQHVPHNTEESGGKWVGFGKWWEWSLNGKACIVQQLQKPGSLQRFNCEVATRSAFLQIPQETLNIFILGPGSADNSLLVRVWQNYTCKSNTTAPSSAHLSRCQWQNLPG